MANTNNYETLYGVQLLDDLHNYFPAILYDSSRFRGVQDLLHYLQINARNRFDLFSFGQRAYLNTNLDVNQVSSSAQSSMPPLIPASLLNPIFTSPPGQNHVAARASRFEEEEEEDTNTQPPHQSTSRTRSVSPEPRITAQIDILHEDLGFDNQALSLLNLLNVLGTMPRIPRRQAVPNNFLDPVIVRPTEAQVEQNSTRSFPSEDTNCAICQDAIPVNQMARRLNVCGHTFHISCIDQWFQRDVRCPTCRHDIREPGEPTRVNQPTVSSTPAASERTE